MGDTDTGRDAIVTMDQDVACYKDGEVRDYASLTSKLAKLEPERLTKITERGKELGWRPEEDVFALVMRKHDCSFKEAVEIVHSWHQDE